MKRYRHVLFAAALSLSGCTLYEPLLPAVPVVRQRGELAGAANWQVPYSGQVAGSWSPVPHGLIFAAGSLHFYNAKRDSSNDYVRAQQYEGGIGGYSTIGGTWLSVAAGAGQGWGYRFGNFKSGGGLFIPTVPGSGPPASPGARPPIPESRGRYTTRFVQLTARWPHVRYSNAEWGANLRVTQVRFTDLTLNGVAQALPSQYNLQAAVTMQQQWRWLGWQASGGYTVPLSEMTDERAFSSAPLRVAAGLIFYPHRKVATAPTPSP